MSLRVFCQPGQAKVGSELELDPQESHYLCRVRRARPQDELELLDTQQRWLGRVVHADTKQARVRVEAAAQDPSPPREIHLYLGIPDVPACLEALELCCEFGVHTVTPVRCAYSQGRFPSASRVDKVLRARMRQCGRPSAPFVHPLLDFEQALPQVHEHRSFVAWAKLRGPLHPLGPVGPQASIWVGPEGGFKPNEVERLRTEGAQELALGPWTLRNPSAVAAAVTRLFDARPDEAAQPTLK